MSEQSGRSASMDDMQIGYMRKDAAAKYLGISIRTLTTWQRKKIVPYIKMSHRICLFRKVDLDRALARYRIRSAGEK